MGSEMCIRDSSLPSPNPLSSTKKSHLTNPQPDQLTITGTGTAAPDLIELPGAYAATDPGILVDIYQSLSTYIAPGPTVYGGFTKSAGDTCSGVETGTETGAEYTGGAAASTNVAVVTSTAAAGTTSAAATSAVASSGGNVTTSAAATSVAATTAPAATSTAAPSGCQSPKYGQCGGEGWTGCTECVDGSTCEDVSPPYYSQCT